MIDEQCFIQQQLLEQSDRNHDLRSKHSATTRAENQVQHSTHHADMTDQTSDQNQRLMSLLTQTSHKFLTLQGKLETDLI